MTKALAHRGPDDAGTLIFHASCATVGMGHRRLSILDLSASGHQPMRYQQYTIVYNGEIYNFREIRQQLQEEGYHFESGSDTEVLLKGYHCWKEKVLDHCIGMFAFAIYDEQKEELLLCRDRAGVKPLYYYWRDNVLLFASELKSFSRHPAFHKEIDSNSLSLFLQFSYIPAPYTIFLHTHKLRPGHWLRLSLAKRSTSEQEYWSVLQAYRQPLLRLNETELIRETTAIMQRAYQYRMVADVPVGVFLSGGYDSSSVAALLQASSSSRIKTFTIGYREPAFDESREAAAIARHLGTDHHEWIIGPDDAANVLEQLPDIYDEPFADNSAVPTILVSRMAAKEVKVALSADGGDELFAGYHKFRQSMRYTTGMPVLMQTALSKVMDWINPETIPYFNKTYNFASRYEKMKMIWAAHRPQAAMKYISQYITEREAQTYLNVPAGRYLTEFDANGSLNNVNDPLNRLLAIDYKTFLSDNNLVKVDRASMSVSMEGREPMLDHHLLEWLARVPASMKIKDGVSKYLLKQIVHQYLPPALMERPKRPFIAPLQHWFRDELKEQLQYYLSPERLARSAYLNTTAVQPLLRRYLAGEKVSHQKLWNMLVFQLWFNRWITPL